MFLYISDDNNICKFAGSEVVTTVLMRSVALRVGTLCRSERARRFEAIYELSMIPAETGGKLRYTKLVYCFVNTSILKMAGIC